MLPGTKDNSGQAARPRRTLSSLRYGFRHPVSLVTASVRPSRTHARAFFTSERWRRRRRRRRRRQVFHLLLRPRGSRRVPDSPRYRHRRHRCTSWGKKKKRWGVPAPREEIGARLPRRRSTPQRIESGGAGAGAGLVIDDDDSKNPYPACRLHFPTPQVAKPREKERVWLRRASASGFR